MVKISQYTQKPPSEHEEQVGLVMWFRNRFPDVLIYAIPNGGQAVCQCRQTLEERRCRGRNA